MTPIITGKCVRSIADLKKVNIFLGTEKYERQSGIQLTGFRETTQRNTIIIKIQVLTSIFFDLRKNNRSSHKLYLDVTFLG